jgi:predicted DNA-binding transcriptional regulator YafY
MIDQYGILLIMENKKKPIRASMPKSALARLLFIDRQIASEKYPNTNDLIKEWEGISASTISRDIAFMKDWLNAPIKYSALRRGYFYSKPYYRIPMGFSGADELLALGMAKNILALYRDTPIYNVAHHLLDSIIAPLVGEEDSNWYESRIVVPQVPSSPLLPDVWNHIISALKENRVLAFDYMGTYDEDYCPRRVRPYQLLFDTGLWYLYGYAEERNETRVFSLCRMKNIALTKEYFSLPKDFDYRGETSGSRFGVFAGQEKYRFKIAFYDYSIVWVNDRQWADDQKITETNNGIIISFTSTQFDKVLEWVLSRGCTARPLEPDLLVDIWREIIDEMKKMTVNAFE